MAEPLHRPVRRGADDERRRAGRGHPHHHRERHRARDLQVQRGDHHGQHDARPDVIDHGAANRFATGANLTRAAESIAYTYTSAAGGSGTGMGNGQDKTLSVTVSVNQANAANVTPGVYTDTIAITLTP